LFYLYQTLLFCDFRFVHKWYRWLPYSRDQDLRINLSARARARFPYWPLCAAANAWRLLAVYVQRLRQHLLSVLNKPDQKFLVPNASNGVQSYLLGREFFPPMVSYPRGRAEPEVPGIY